MITFQCSTPTPVGCRINRCLFEVLRNELSFEKLLDWEEVEVLEVAAMDEWEVADRWELWSSIWSSWTDSVYSLLSPTKRAMALIRTRCADWDGGSLSLSRVVSLNKVGVASRDSDLKGTKTKPSSAEFSKVVSILKLFFKIVKAKIL